MRILLALMSVKYAYVSITIRPLQWKHAAEPLTLLLGVAVVGFLAGTHLTNTFTS
jgi:hypothetical protein